MKRFPIFKAGRHTAMSGSSLDFSEDTLRAAVAAYDPALHEAPIVVGHPKDNHPAFGWVGALSFNEKTGEIEVDPKEVDADFAELVQSGRYKKRSASWYLPDSPNNPKPGSLYLRHVGFLGAMPPAVKGLRDVSFNEAEEGVVEFGESSLAFGAIADALRGLREWLIGKEGQEAEPAAIGPSFSEGDLMTIEELKAQVAKLTAERDAAVANAKPADFAEREAGIAAREAAVAQAEAAQARAKIEGRVDAAIAAGRLLPAQRKHAIDFAASLAEGEAVIDFGEGDKAQKVTQREAYLRQIEAAPKAVEFGELSGDKGAGDASKIADPAKLADKARELIAKGEKEGNGAMSFTEAVALATVELSGQA